MPYMHDEIYMITFIMCILIHMHDLYPGIHGSPAGTAWLQVFVGVSGVYDLPMEVTSPWFQGKISRWFVRLRWPENG